MEGPKKKSVRNVLQYMRTKRLTESTNWSREEVRSSIRVQRTATLGTQQLQLEFIQCPR